MLRAGLPTKQPLERLVQTWNVNSIPGSSKRCPICLIRRSKKLIRGCLKSGRVLTIVPHQIEFDFFLKFQNRDLRVLLEQTQPDNTCAETETEMDEDDKTPQFTNDDGVRLKLLLEEFALPRTDRPQGCQVEPVDKDSAKAIRKEFLDLTREMWGQIPSPISYRDIDKQQQGSHHRLTASFGYKLQVLLFGEKEKLYFGVNGVVDMPVNDGEFFSDWKITFVPQTNYLSVL